MSFLPPQLLDSGQMTALGLSRNGNSVWLVDDQLSLFASGDGGATFKIVGPVNGPIENCCYVFGTSDLFALSGGVVNVASLADPTQNGSFTGASGRPFAAAIDDSNVVTIFSQSANGQDLLATRFGGADQLSAATVVGPLPSQGGAVALSRHATTTVSIAGSQLTFTILTWP